LSCAFCIPSLSFISQRRLYLCPGFSLKASLLVSWQCPAIRTSQSTRCATCRSPIKRKYRRSSKYYRCENLIINLFLLPLLLMQRIACDRTLSSYQSLLRVEPLKASCGCPSGVLFTLTFLEMWFVSAPRRVLMRCMARREVVIQLTGHYSTSLSFLSLIDLCQL